MNQPNRIAITAPVLAYEIFGFINPALYPRERRAVYPFLASFLVLFVVGLFFGYLVLVPYGITALLPFFQIVGAELYISVADFYYFVFFLTLLTGKTYTFPIFLVLFVKFGIIGTNTLTKNRKYVYFGLLALVFLITPGEWELANFMLLAVMIVLFEIGFFSRDVMKREAKLGVHVGSLKKQNASSGEKQFQQIQPSVTTAENHRNELHGKMFYASCLQIWLDGS